MSASEHQSEIELDPDRVAAWREQDSTLQLIDVREPDEREAGHIEGSAHIELIQLPAQAQSIERDRAVVFYCRVGSRSLSDGQRRRLLARAGPVVAAVAQDERSQARNRELALRRLAERLATALKAPKPRRRTVPSAASRARRLAAKRRISELKRERRPPEGPSDQ